MKRYLYLFWHHNNAGPEDVKATVERDRVLPLFREYMARVAPVWNIDSTSHVQVDEKLRNLLSKDDAELVNGEGFNLMGFEGGLHFQVVLLE